MCPELTGYVGQDDEEIFVLESDTEAYDPTPVTTFRLVVPGLGTFASDEVEGLFTWPVAAKDRQGNACQGVMLTLGAAEIPAGRYFSVRVVGVEPGYPAGRTWGSFALRMVAEAQA